MTGRAGPVRKADPQQVAQLAADGHGRNSVARTLGVSRRAVDEAARAAGVTWVRSSTEAATRARLADTRAELADTFTEAADLAGDRLIEELRRDQIDPGTIRALATVAGISTDKLIALGDRLSATDGSADSLLDQLRGGIDSWAAGLAEQDQDQDQIITNPQEGTA